MNEREPHRRRGVIPSRVCRASEGDSERRESRASSWRCHTAFGLGMTVISMLVTSCAHDFDAAKKIDIDDHWFFGTTIEQNGHFIDRDQMVQSFGSRPETAAAVENHSAVMWGGVAAFLGGTWLMSRAEPDDPRHDPQRLGGAGLFILGMVVHSWGDDQLVEAAKIHNRLIDEGQKKPRP